MSNFEIDNDYDIDMTLIKYTENYLKELNYFGTSKTEQMLLLISLGSEISQIEKYIFDSYDNYVKLVLNDENDSNIYYLHKIFFASTNLIIKMIKFWILEQKNTKEFNYKLIYLIGSLENYIDNVIEPIESKLQNIVCSNNFFKLDNSTKYLKQFINMNKNNFSSKNKIQLLNKLINILNNTQ